jgi:hypothetical protein
MYGHAKDPTEFDGVQKGERVIFPGACLDWIGPHVVGMETLLHQVQAVGVDVCLALLKFEVYHGSMSERM